MTASTFGTAAPKNRYAAERMGIAYSQPESRDAFSYRRHTTAIVAGIFLVANILALAAFLPAMVQTVTDLASITSVVQAPK